MALNFRQQMSICACFPDRYPGETNPDQFVRKLSTLETLCEKEFLLKNLVPCVLSNRRTRSNTSAPLLRETISRIRRDMAWRCSSCWKNSLAFLTVPEPSTHDADVENIKWLIETDLCLGLSTFSDGYIYQSNGHVDQAVRCYLNHWSPVTRKPIFEVCDQMRLKPACLATVTSYRLEISDIASRGITLSRQQTTKALIRLRGCAGWSAPLLFAYDINRFSHDVAHWLYVLITILHLYTSKTLYVHTVLT